METGRLTKGKSRRETFLSIASTLTVTLVTLALLEVLLRTADFRELRDTMSETSLAYDFDAELGWAPAPGSEGKIVTFRTTHYKHNSLGLRDEEFRLDAKPTIMFLGDSFVWGLDSEADERFTDLLKPRIRGPQDSGCRCFRFRHRSGISAAAAHMAEGETIRGGVDRCPGNDHDDNMRSVYYFHYHKPYFATQSDGSLKLMGQPVPRSHLMYFRDHWLVRNLWLARLVTNVYIRLMHPKVTVPDPTEKLVTKIREFVEANGARFMVGITHRDEALVRFLEANRIPLVELEGADFIKPSKENIWGAHWTPEGQKDVAERIYGMLSANGIVRADAALAK